MNLNFLIREMKLVIFTSWDLCEDQMRCSSSAWALPGGRGQVLGYRQCVGHLVGPQQGQGRPCVGAGWEGVDLWQVTTEQTRTSLVVQAENPWRGSVACRGCGAFGQGRRAQAGWSVRDCTAGCGGCRRDWLTWGRSVDFFLRRTQNQAGLSGSHRNQCLPQAKPTGSLTWGPTGQSFCPQVPPA